MDLESLVYLRSTLDSSQMYRYTQKYLLLQFFGHISDENCRVCKLISTYFMYCFLVAAAREIYITRNLKTSVLFDLSINSLRPVI